MATAGTTLYIIGYEYTTAEGKHLKKAVLCSSEEEYRRVKATIVEAEKHGVSLITFDEFMNSREIP